MRVRRGRRKRGGVTVETTIVFNLESEDPSVGIFGKGFSAWLKDGAEWCDLADYQDSFESCKFMWYNSESGNVCARPDKYADVVEHALHGWAVGVYASEEAVYKDIETEDDYAHVLISEDRPLPHLEGK